MAIACLLVPAFPLFCELAAYPALHDRPVALSNPGRTRVVERTPAAARYGVQAGMTLREALGYCPLLTVLEPRPARQQEIARALADAMLNVSPLVEEAAPGTVYADLRGLETLFPTPETPEYAVRAALPGALEAQLGIAESKFTAYVAALTAPAAGRQIIPAEQSAAFLAPQHVRALPWDPEDIERLVLLGLRTLGALAALPRSALEAQFGRAGGWAWDAAQGNDASPIVPIERDEEILESLDADPPLVSREAVDYGMRQLLGRALRQPAVEDRFPRTIYLRITAEDDRVWEHEHVLKEPSNNRDTLWRVVRGVLDGATYPAPVTHLTLGLLNLSTEAAAQTPLFPGKVRYRNRLNQMVRELKVRYRATPVKRLVEVEPWSRIPERRYALMDYDP